MFFKSAPKKLLIVDDDASLLRLLRARLEKRNKHNVTVADNAASGLEKAEADSFDLIILDWMLPDMQGIDVLSRIKADKATSKVPVLMLTGRNKIGEIEEAFDRGADGYLTKPIELAKLGDKVKQLLAA